MSELKHHGVKGMHWGVRRYQNYDGTRIGAKHRSGGEKSVVRKAVAKGTNDASSGKKSLNQRRLERAAKTSYRDADELEKAGYKEEAKAVRKVADNNSSKAKKIEAIRREAEAQQKQLDELRKNGDLSEKDYNRLKNDTPKTLIGLKKDKRIMNEADANSHSKEIEKAKEKLKSEKSVVKKQIKNERNEKLFTSQEKRISRDAKKDAEEFARAKAFYGEGAGNRRKAIKTTVEAKKKKDSFYTQEFEWHLAQQDMEYHMKKATAERKRKDTQKSAKRTARKIENGIQFVSRFI